MHHEFLFIMKKFIIISSVILLTSDFSIQTQFESNSKLKPELIFIIHVILYNAIHSF